MSLFSKPFFVTIVCLSLLSACGFKPMYGAPSASGVAPSAGVSVETASPDRRISQQFKIDLEDKLNPNGAVPKNAQYKLVASIKSSTSAIGIARDGTISRYNVYLDSDYTLFRTGEEKPVATGKLRHVSSYNNRANQYYSTFVSEQDALKRGVTEMAELFKQRLSPQLATR